MPRHQNRLSSGLSRPQPRRGQPGPEGQQRRAAHGGQRGSGQQSQSRDRSETPRPLPDCLHLPKRRFQDGNAGLWFNKLAAGWEEKDGRWQVDREHWVTVLDQLGFAGRIPVGKAPVLEAYRQRMSRLAGAIGAECFTGRTASRLLVGVGQPHPMEISLTWHHAYGVPYVPGSSLKGLVRSWAELWSGASGDEVVRIFGAATDRADKAAGSVIFFDALPAQPVHLELDYMTPHYSPYYEDNDGRVYPADWHSPRPLGFVTVRAGEDFFFMVAPRRAGMQGQADVERARNWLVEALQTLGAGAKSGSGYGLFAIDDALFAADEGGGPAG